ncbi:hypothetical protein [Paracoccus sp. (in: a-proteobacteria)]|uniref:hypothetical protein n=1 Tax=Paracoccus sp. TaxID=267 RepID=UPI0035B4329B
MTNILLKHAPAIMVLVAALFFAVQAISGVASAVTAAQSGMLGGAETINVVIVTLVTSAFQPAILLGLAAIAHHLARAADR